MLTIRSIFGIITFCLCLTSCGKKAEGIDKELLDKSESTEGFRYYRENDEIFSSSQPSAHNPYFRTRFNQIAFEALTDSGRLPAGDVFPEGSLVVKELFDKKNGELKILAIMEKDTDSPYSADGWIWGEYRANGSVFISAEEKGSSCVSCHRAASRDLVRLFDLFP